jgi:TPR repeat protein
LVVVRRIFTIHLSDEYRDLGDLKKAKFHLEAAAMAGHEGARSNIGHLEFLQFNNTDRAIKYWIIAASTGDYKAMQCLLIAFNQGLTSRAIIDATLTAYNTSCAGMRSDSRDAAIRLDIASIGTR